MITNIYYEKCIDKTMPYYPFFLTKLDTVEKISKRIINDKLIANYCPDCITKKCYQLGNIIWPTNMRHIMNVHKTYPNEYFIKIIINSTIINGTIINPPLQINPSKIKYFCYVILHSNKLLILDALMKQGSYPRYVSGEDIKRYIYSEHSGAISVENSRVKNIIVSTEDRIDATDDDIYLPTNSDLLAKHPFLFHTHPITQSHKTNTNQYSIQVYAGRLDDGILYEFPSANDIFNFIKYRRHGLAQASIVVAPEGLYVTRPLIFQMDNMVDKSFHKNLQKYILQLEKMAVDKYGKIVNIQHPDIFHQNVSNDISYIKLYNNFLKKINLYVEYYPRQNKNNEWVLPEIHLPYVHNN